MTKMTVTKIVMSFDTLFSDKKKNKPPQNVQKHTVNAVNSKLCNRRVLSRSMSNGFPTRCKTILRKTKNTASNACISTDPRIVPNVPSSTTVTFLNATTTSHHALSSR